MKDCGAIRVIVNPTGGSGAAARHAKSIRALLDEAWPLAEWNGSRSAQHVTDMCREAADRQFTRVVVLGGDGTIHHAVRGLANTSTALAIIPSGTGNDFAAAARIPADPVAAARTMLTCEARPVDLGAVNGIPFCCVAGVGLDTPALQFINRSRIGGRQLLYYVAAIRTLLSYASCELRIEANDATIRDRVLLAVVGNTPTYAGGNPVTPNARICDALLDYCVFADQPLPERVMTFMQMKRGCHFGRVGVSSGVSETVRIDGDVPVPVTMDGELTTLTTPAEIRVMPGALKLVCRKAA
jgi:diacylglycerol kinase (ATP)